MITEPIPHGLAFLRSGAAVPLAVQNSPPLGRPYLHPLMAPDGIGVLTEDRPPHHPWQHGLYTGINDVNGVGFWTEGLHVHPERDGCFASLGKRSLPVVGSSPCWEVHTAWRSPDGHEMLRERQTWLLADRPLERGYHLDLRWELRATIDLHFGRYDYGGLFIRMAYRPELGAAVLNSKGHRTIADADTQRAQWVAL